MPPAIPTPYDIAPIPVLPWSPGGSVWLAVILLGLGGLVIVSLYRRLGLSRAFSAAAALQSELRELAPQVRHVDRERLIKLTQRSLIFLGAVDVRGLSSEELVALGQQEGYASVRRLLTLLATLENDHYAPPQSHDNPETIEHARELCHALQEFLLDGRRA